MVFKVYSGDTIVDTGLLALGIEEAAYGSPTQAKDNVWQDLVSSGNSDLISNSQLRLAISEYFNMLEMHWQLHRNNWVDDQNKTYDLTSRVFPWKDRALILESFRSSLKTSELVIPEISMDFNAIRDKLKALPDIESILFTMYNIHDANVILDESEILEIKTILGLLEEEIEKFN